jgi:hypothetical protein
MTQSSPFKSFWMGGFECSTHRLRSGKRLDLIEATRHDRFAHEDYLRLAGVGIHTARDAVRWHLIEQSPGRYDFSSVLPQVRAAREAGVQVIWDLCHYGWPDDIDVFKPEFVRRFAGLARAFVRFLVTESDLPPMISPVNEISFLSWAGGDSAHLNPYCIGRGFELKRQLARAAIEGIEAIWAVHPATRIIHVDPVVHIVADPDRPHEQDLADGYRWAQYQGWDMLRGWLCPELGGDVRYLDIIGVNYYPHNQWVYEGPVLERSDPRYRPFRDILREVYERYKRPLFVAETGTEDGARPEWLSYIGREARAALRGGIPLLGICLYPIVNHPGWVDERHCHNGLWDYADDLGERERYEPLARELARQQRLLGEMCGQPGLRARGVC